jgi:hypothetical protein
VIGAVLYGLIPTYEKIKFGCPARWVRRVWEIQFIHMKKANNLELR